MLRSSISPTFSGKSTSKTVSLKTPIPVVLFYTTATTDADNQAIFSPDVYLRDPMLEKLLATHSHAAKAKPSSP